MMSNSNLEFLDQTQKRRYKYILATIIIGILGLIQGLIYNIIYSNTILIFIECFILGTLLYFINLIKKDVKYYNTISTIMSLEIVIMFNLLYAFSSIEDLKIIWIFIYAPALISINNKNIGTIWLLLLFGLIYAQQIQGYYEISYTLSQTIYVTIVVLLFTILLNYFNHTIEEYIKQVIKEKEKYARLTKELDLKIEDELNKNRQKDITLQLQSKYVAMGEMIELISHQWRQPLNELGLVFQKFDFAYKKDILSSELITQETDKGNKLIQRMSDTIDDFRNFLNPNFGEIKFEVSKSIKETISLFSQSSDYHDIRVVLELNSSKNIFNYKSELEQVILNIFTNAKEALTEKDMEDKLIVISLKESNNNLLIKIKDNAGGVNKNILDKIFDPHFTTKEDGTGLGLYMSKQIIENHIKGKLTCNDTDFIFDGKDYFGACFSIEIPY